MNRTVNIVLLTSLGLGLSLGGCGKPVEKVKGHPASGRPMASRGEATARCTRMTGQHGTSLVGMNQMTKDQLEAVLVNREVLPEIAERNSLVTICAYSSPGVATSSPSLCPDGETYAFQGGQDIQYAIGRNGTLVPVNLRPPQGMDPACPWD